MQPAKDYDDYTSFINDAFADDKNKLIKTAESFDLKRSSYQVPNIKSPFQGVTSKFENSRTSLPDSRHNEMNTYLKSIMK